MLTLLHVYALFAAPSCCQWCSNYHLASFSSRFIKNRDPDLNKGHSRALVFSRCVQRLKVSPPSLIIRTRSPSDGSVEDRSALRLSCSEPNETRGHSHGARVLFHSDLEGPSRNVQYFQASRGKPISSPSLQQPGFRRLRQHFPALSIAVICLQMHGASTRSSVKVHNRVKRVVANHFTAGAVLLFSLFASPPPHLPLRFRAPRPFEGQL